MKLITSKLAGRMSVLLVMAMLLSLIPPAYAADKPASVPTVISDFIGNVNISIGKGEGVLVGTKGVITRDGKEIAKYEVKQVDWGYSKIDVINLQPGYSVRVGDNAQITSIPGDTGAKKSHKKSSSKVLWTILAIGAVAALISGGGGGGGSSAPAAATTVTLAAESASMPADGSSTVDITITVRDTSGAAVPNGTAVTFTTTAGTIVPAQATTTNGTATATLTAASTAGRATVTATSGGQSATTNVSFVTGGTPTMSVAAGPATIQVVGSGGENTESTITATCRDASGNLATSGTVTFSTSIGTIIGTSEVNASGIATSTFTSNETGTATITAAWSGAQATTNVDITPGPPYSVVVDCVPASIQCDGNSFATITATVKDIAGNPVTDGTVVQFDTRGDSHGGNASFQSQSLVNTGTTIKSSTNDGVATALLFSKDPTGAISTAGTATIDAFVKIADQPTGVPAPASDISNLNATYVQIVSMHGGTIALGAVKYNIRGLDIVGNSTKIVALVYDINHNPVPDGTAVYFTSDYGMIYGDAGTAGRVTVSVTKNGRAQATLESTAEDMNGIVTVTATSGESTAQDQVIFSGPPYPHNCSATIEPASAELAPTGGQAVITVNALDVNGNPLVDGTAITAVTTKGKLTVEGSATTIGGTMTFTLKTSDGSTAPTGLGPGKVTITIPSDGINPETGGQPVILTVNFTVAD